MEYRGGGGMMVAGGGCEQKGCAADGTGMMVREWRLGFGGCGFQRGDDVGYGFRVSTMCPLRGDGVE